MVFLCISFFLQGFLFCFSPVTLVKKGILTLYSVKTILFYYTVLSLKIFCDDPLGCWNCQCEENEISQYVLKHEDLTENTQGQINLTDCTCFSGAKPVTTKWHRVRWGLHCMFFAAFGQRGQSVFSWKTSRWHLENVHIWSFWWRFSRERGLTALPNTPLDPMFCFFPTRKTGAIC